ncbi:MAG TPA: glycosyltransferase family 1 protein, partial [Candidatus Cloacimonadota bacterium]|nr:glycosyltransferase family 1 protein [Candidatus Cloacimonadota bacterium]
IMQGNLSYYLVPEYLKRPILSMLWHLYCLPHLIKNQGWEKIFLPAANRRLLCSYPIPTALTFHDLSQFHIPGKYNYLRMLYIRHVVPHYLKNAPTVFAISESTKVDMIRYYGMKPESITVNYNGFNPEKLKGDLNVEQLLERFGIKKRYMLYIARVEHPGKNHINLLKAYELLPQEIKDEYELVCAGSKWSNSEAVLSYHAGMKDKTNIHFPGFVSGVDMAALYKNASLYVFPSLYEGFGLPLLEAFSAGVPVVCSDRSSLPEIGTDAVRCFNPEDPNDIANTILSVLNDPPLMIQMIYLGKERLRDFSWERHASKIVESLTCQR